MTGHGVHSDCEQLNAELARAYSRMADLSRELADEQALTRQLRSVIALAPYNNPRPAAAPAPPPSPPTSRRPAYPPRTLHPHLRRPR